MEERILNIYCPTHKIGFPAAADAAILCENGGHALAQDFPAGEDWEYCCDCQTFWPAGAGAKGRERCPVCERTIDRRYLCDSCRVLSYESREAGRRRPYAIGAQGAITPACPGCLAPPLSTPRAHQCDETQTSFFTARSVCPFCDDPVGDPPSFPSSAADCLGKVTRKGIEATFDVKKKLLVSAPGGEFVLVPGGSAAPPIAVPRLTRFATRQDYFAYQDFYDGTAAAGEVWIVHPAVVDKTDEGWLLRERGRFDIRPEEPSPQAAPVTTPLTEPLPTPQQPQTAPAGVGLQHCPRCGTPGAADNLFCSLCGYNFAAGPYASAQPTAPYPPHAGAAYVPPAPYYTEAAHVAPPLDADAVDTLPLSGAGEPDEPTVVVPRTSSGRRVGAVVAVLLLAAVLAVVAAVALRRGVSLEEKMDRAIASGRLFTPSGDSAYDYYQQLKSQGASPAVLSRFGGRLFPLLTSGPKQLLVDFAQPGTEEPSLTQWEDARRQLAWATELKPEDAAVAARAEYCRGRIAYLNDRKGEALESWKKASQLDPTWALATNGVGLIHNERKEYDKARPYLREAISREPNWAIPYNNLGTSYYYQQRYDEAETYYLKAVERAQNWGRPHAWLGDIAKYRRDYDRAVREYEIVLDPSTIGTSRMDLGLIRQRLEEVRQLAGQNSSSGF